VFICAYLWFPTELFRLETFEGSLIGEIQ